LITRIYRSIAVAMLIGSLAALASRATVTAYFDSCVPKS